MLQLPLPIEWQAVAISVGGSRKALESFFRKAYGCCSTFSASRETEPRKISEVQPGDVQVYPVRSNKRPRAIRQQGRRISFAI